MTNNKSRTTSREEACHQCPEEYYPLGIIKSYDSYHNAPRRVFSNNDTSAMATELHFVGKQQC